MGKTGPVGGQGNPGKAGLQGLPGIPGPAVSSGFSLLKPMTGEFTYSLITH